jgi:hypothetical protein
MNPTPVFNKRLTVTLAAILTLCWTLSPPPADADMVAEIDHLLRYIEASGCTFHRNGKDHDGGDAGAHIRRKYTHTKRWIETTEDFIKYTATKSSVSGSPYDVTCNGVQTPTARWLTDELTRFREKAP